MADPWYLFCIMYVGSFVYDQADLLAAGLYLSWQIFCSWAGC